MPNDTEPPGVMNAEWGHDSVCVRRMLKTNNQYTKLNISWNFMPTKLQLFKILFPKDYIINVVLKETNKTIVGPPVEYGEFLVWLGLWLLMETCQGKKWMYFWSLKAIDMFCGTPCRFNNIILSLFNISLIKVNFKG